MWRGVLVPSPILALTLILTLTLTLSLTLTLTLTLTRCEHKDIKRIANWIEGHLLGTFVKTVMRIISYVDVTREVLLGLGEYEAHNALDNHTDLLLGGLVTNESLYLRLAD